MIKEPNFKSRIIARVWSEINIRTANNCTKNLFSYNLADIFINFFDNLSFISIYNSDNIFNFYDQLFSYLTLGLLSNGVLTNFSYFFFNLNKIEVKNCFNYSLGMVSLFF